VWYTAVNFCIQNQLRRYNWGNNNRGQLGRVVQSDLIKPTLKPPEIKRVETEV
jgi:alpha-tubulin suppressor-like RCC1 family protein